MFLYVADIYIFIQLFVFTFEKIVDNSETWNLEKILYFVCLDMF